MKEIIDIHIHMSGPGDEPSSGCYFSEKFVLSPAFLAMLIVTDSLFKKVSTKSIRKKIVGEIKSSRKIDKGVLLALDMAYNESGEPLANYTHLFTPNNYIISLCKRNQKLLFGASVHPYRKDAIDELERCIENGAVLCKWIPSSQLIDPYNEKCVKFFKRLADKNLPLLCHTGPEHAVPTSIPEFSKFDNPIYLRKALEMGVIVIAAHCATPYFGRLDPDYFDQFLSLMEDSENRGLRLFGDISALATPFRIPYAKRIKEEIPPEKLLFGSDYPIPISDFSFTKNKRDIIDIFRVMLKAKFRNSLDHYYYILKEEMDFSDSVFTNFSLLIEKIKR
ncbi:MAG: amidohydrolase family protein [Candidatus Aminicenantia bacterium]